jgi:two-component system OmpR family sensor kinase
MNKLWVRLTLAILIVTLVTVIVVALLTGQRAGEAFQRYVAQRNQEQGVQPENNFPPPYRPGPPGHHMGALLEDQFIDNLHGVLVVAAVIAGGTGAVLGFVISRTVAAPLANLSEAARDFAAQKWDRRVTVQGTDEIADVARAFNAMADELQRAETLRRNLMADIAHELRTPLTVMQGNLRALLDGVYPLEMREIATLYDETRLLSRLVADLRELALAEAGRLPLNMQTLPLEPILGKAVDQFSAAAEAQNTQLQQVESLLPPVQADPDRLAQVLHNLLANALRHTPGGSITISGERADNQVRIRVCDTGEGITPADLPHIFDRFYRAGDSRDGSNSGLGLAIAKAWVEAMGGTIGVESNTPQGSTFWFTVKVA